MDFTLQNSTYIILVVLTGLSAGLCFTWENAVTPGIGRLDDIGFLKAFQQMNRAILNPIFFIVFFGPFLLGLINIYLFKNASTTILWSLIIATVIYFFGVAMVTIFGNVPLNELLDKSELSAMNIEELKLLRHQFEATWNRLHFIRTITSLISFIILIITTQNI